MQQQQQQHHSIIMQPQLNCQWCATGDQYVDWVGLSVYHFGGNYPPFITNVVPGQTAFKDQVITRLAAQQQPAAIYNTDYLPFVEMST